MITPRSLLYVGSPKVDMPQLVEGLEPDWTLTAAQPEQALELMEKETFWVGLVDLDRAEPKLEELLSTPHPIQWIALTTPEGMRCPANRQLIYHTCFDYHTRPLDVPRLAVILGHAWGMAQLNKGTPAAKKAKPSSQDSEMVASSSAMHQVSDAIQKVAQVDAPLLLLGESGTGKELTARAVCKRSERAKRPFIAINCGALPEQLVQSELFGHEKGAFTGAHQRRIGRIEAAHGGTVLLDEIGDLPPNLQVNLLRFLQEQRIQRVGGTEEIPVNVRVIAATHRDLDVEVAAGSFREDLYYRLNVLHLRIPPLRERKEDIEPLAHFYLEKLTQEYQSKVQGFTSQALKVMRTYTWPGNVREMINRIHRAMVMGDNRLITANDLGLDCHNRPCHTRTLARARAQAEKRAIQMALDQTEHNVTQASRMLDVSRPTLYRLMERYELNAGTP